MKEGQDWFRNPWELSVFNRFVTSILSTYDVHKLTQTLNLLCSKVTRMTWCPSNDCDVLRGKNVWCLTYMMPSLMTKFTWERDAEKPFCSSSTNHSAATERTRKFWWLMRAASFPSDKKCSSYCSYLNQGFFTGIQTCSKTPCLISTLMPHFEHLPLFFPPANEVAGR